MDVLENGPSSPYASYFDIDWMPLQPDLAYKVTILNSGAVNALVPVVTLKNRLPTPSARLQSSVINHPIVCVPFVSVDQSKTTCPPAAALFEKPRNAPASSEPRGLTTTWTVSVIRRRPGAAFP